MVQLLYDLGADVHRARTIDGGRPIHDAAKYGHDRTVLLLLSLRADVDATNGFLSTPLAAAAKAGHLGVVKSLINAGAGNLGLEITAGTIQGWDNRVVRYLRSAQEERVQAAAIGEVD